MNGGLKKANRICITQVTFYVLSQLAQNFKNVDLNKHQLIGTNFLSELKKNGLRF